MTIYDLIYALYDTVELTIEEHGNPDNIIWQGDTDELPEKYEGYEVDYFQPVGDDLVIGITYDEDDDEDDED